MSMATDSRVKRLEEVILLLEERICLLEQKPAYQAANEGLSIAGLIEKYKAKFGKPPHHKMKPETIAQALK